MKTRLDRVHRAVAVVLGGVTLAAVGALFAWDAFPAWFPAGAHRFLAAFSLALIAVAYLVYQAVRRPARWEWLKAILLAAAFFCWAGNQIWPDWQVAMLLNDIAIGLFVFDVFLVMIGWPSTSADESFAETDVESPDPRSSHAR
jgi:hypothetical protein